MVASIHLSRQFRSISGQEFGVCYGGAAKRPVPIWATLLVHLTKRTCELAPIMRQDRHIIRIEIEEMEPGVVLGA